MDEKKPMKLKTVKRLKKVLLAFEILIGLIIISAAVIWFVPSAKEAFIKGFASSSLGKTILGWFAEDDYNNSVVDEDFDEEELVTNESIDKSALAKYTQILIVGIDTRDDEFDVGVNSDVLMIVTINNETDDVNLVSVYRDTVMQMVTDTGEVLDYYAKANHAYCAWGIKGAINTLNINLDLNITEYAIVNFEGVTKVVDALGGIDVNLTQEEVYQLNQHLADTKLATGLYAANVTSAGWNHLDGLQTTTYCRIRKTLYYDEDTGEALENDMGRTARQQATIRKLVARARSIGLTQTLDLMKAVFNQNSDEDRFFKTSLTWDEIMTVVSVAFDFDLAENQGYPFDYAYADDLFLPGSTMAASYVVGQGTLNNVQKLHAYIYPKEDYSPSERIYLIDQTVSSLTGVYAPSE
jgi:LCP family protein required for cell wall assembly